MSRLMDSYEELVAEVMSLRRELLHAEEGLLLWILGMFIVGLAFGLIMFVAGANSEAARVAMEGLK